MPAADKVFLSVSIASTSWGHVSRRTFPSDTAACGLIVANGAGLAGQAGAPGAINMSAGMQRRDIPDTAASGPGTAPPLTKLNSTRFSETAGRSMGASGLAGLQRHVPRPLQPGAPWKCAIIVLAESQPVEFS